MGLFDEIHCKMPLPGDPPDFVLARPLFQTYDLGRGMGDYTITGDGRLLMDGSMATHLLEQVLQTGDITPLCLGYKRKRIEMHADNVRGGRHVAGQYRWFTEGGVPAVHISYVVQVRNGRVSSIKEKWRKEEPALPFAEFHVDTAGPSG